MAIIPCWSSSLTDSSRIRIFALSHRRRSCGIFFSSALFFSPVRVLLWFVDSRKIRSILAVPAARVNLTCYECHSCRITPAEVSTRNRLCFVRRLASKKFFLPSIWLSLPAHRSLLSNGWNLCDRSDGGSSASELFIGQLRQNTDLFVDLRSDLPLLLLQPLQSIRKRDSIIGTVARLRPSISSRVLSHFHRIDAAKSTLIRFLSRILNRNHLFSFRGWRQGKQWESLNYELNERLNFIEQKVFVNWATFYATVLYSDVAINRCECLVRKLNGWPNKLDDRLDLKRENSIDERFWGQYGMKRTIHRGWISIGDGWLSLSALEHFLSRARRKEEDCRANWKRQFDVNTQLIGLTLVVVAAVVLISL